MKTMTGGTVTFTGDDGEPIKFAIDAYALGFEEPPKVTEMGAEFGYPNMSFSCPISGGSGLMMFFENFFKREELSVTNEANRRMDGS